MGADVRDVCEKDTNNSDVVFGESFGEAKQIFKMSKNIVQSQTSSKSRFYKKAYCKTVFTEFYDKMTTLI